jgi:hypothetical protein
LASTTTVNAGAVLDSTAKFGIGYTDAAPASDTAPPGFLDDIRVYDGTLSAQELNAVRLANVPEPATGALVLVAVVSLLSTRHRNRPRQ